jgi:hypothetical protein
MTTTLSTSFLRAVVVITSNTPEPMKRAKAALLLFSLRQVDFTAAVLPAEITNGSRHLAGAATGSLIAEGFLKVVGRVKSPHSNAKGRKLDLLRGVSSERTKTWLRTNAVEIPIGTEPVDPQGTLL